MSHEMQDNPANGATIFNTAVTRDTEIDVAGNANITLTDDLILQHSCLVFTGALTGNIEVTVPAASNAWDVVNATTGAYSLTLKASGTTGLAVTQGKTARLRYLPALSDVVIIGRESA